MSSPELERKRAQEKGQREKITSIRESKIERERERDFMGGFLRKSHALQGLVVKKMGQKNM